MESIGEKLRFTREAKKLTIKQVVKDTNISSSYIEALEDEEFDRFPSETYLVGFLRSYSEYLKLDSDEIIQAYKGYKIGESVTPLEELTKPTNPSLSMFFSSFTSKYKNTIFILSIAIVAFLLFLGFQEIIKRNSVDNKKGINVIDIKNDINNKNKNFNIRNLQISFNKGFDLIYKDEAVQFPVDNKVIIFLLKDIKEDKVVIEFHPSKQLEVLDLNKPKVLKLHDSPRDVTFTLKGLTKNRAKIMIALGENADLKEEKVVHDDPKGEYTSVVAMDKRNLKIVFEVAFNQTCFVELYLDGVKKRLGFVPSGLKKRWEANEVIQVKLGNAGGVKVKINGKEFIFGGTGQVANKVITWQKDIQKPNLYHIIVNDGS